MQASRVVSIRTADGQTLPVAEQRHPSRSYGMQFHTSFTEPNRQLASRLRSAVAARLLLILPAHLDYVTFRRLDQRKIAAEIDVTNGAISKALAELTALGVVERRGKGPVVEWRLSLDYGWRGDVDSFHAERRKRGKPAPGAGIVPADDCRIRNIMETRYAGHSSTWPSKPGFTPGGRLRCSHAQSRSVPICVSTVRRAPTRAAHSSARSSHACVRCGAR